MSRGYRSEDRDDDAGDLVRLDDVVALTETAAGLLVLLDDGTQRWVPKSQIHDDSEVYGYRDEDARGPGRLVVRGWWARREGLA